MLCRMTSGKQSVDKSALRWDKWCMKVEPAFPVSGMSGSDRRGTGKNFYIWKGKQIARDVPYPTNRNTAEQSAARQAFRIRQADWYSLSDGDRLAWESFADRMNLAGDRKPPLLSGLGAFLRVQIPGFLSGQALLGVPEDVVPANVCLSANWIKATVVGVGTNVNLTFSHGSVGSEWVSILISEPFSTLVRTARRPDMRSFWSLQAGQFARTWIGLPEQTFVDATEQTFCVEGEIRSLWVRSYSADFWPGPWNRFPSQVVIAP